MEWGILFILILLLLISYVIVQETRAQMHWRGLVEQGDLGAMRTLIEDEVEHWHTARVPRGVPALLWHGVQTVELIAVGPKAARLNCSAEGESAFIAGRRVETSSALEEAKKITMKLAEMAFYDIPNVKLEKVQIDVYTSFRDQSGRGDSLCILSTLVERSEVEHLDWEETPASEFIELVGGRYVSDGSGRIQSIEPLPWGEGAARSS
jgi:hypothetical protein